MNVHCKDRSRGPVAVGDGNIPIDKVVRRLNETGYDGYYVIEHFDADNQMETIKRSADYLKQL